MREVVIVRSSAQAYFGACEAELGRRAGTGQITAHRLDLASAACCVLTLFPPQGAFWGIAYRHTPALQDWEEALRINPSFAAAVVPAVRAHYGDVSLAPPVFVRFSVLGSENDIEIGQRAATPPPTRVQSICAPLDEAVIASVCARFLRYGQQLDGFAVVHPAAAARADSADWELGTHPKLQALFSPDHGRGVLGRETTTNALAALTDALDHVAADEAVQWLTPLALVEEFVRFRYPIPLAARAASRRPVLVLFAGSGDAAFPDALSQVALLRAKLLRKWGWPTWLHTVSACRRPELHAAMLAGRPAWMELESEVDAILEGARARYPVLFEP